VGAGGFFGVQLPSTMAANSLSSVLSEGDVSEVTEWIESLVDVLHREGPDRVRQLLVLLQEEAYRRGVTLPFTANTPYINTIHRDKQPRFPGNREIERRIKSIVRWNAMAMVVRANREHSGLGSISKGMPRPGSTPARSSRAGCPSRTSRTSGKSWPPPGGSLPIPTPG
jgi:hypothetical protein